jgi:glutamate racemase
VVACNTATSAALELLRAAFAVPIVGMEPGVKPAIQATRNGRVGVLATDGTLAGTRFAALVKRFATGVAVHTVPGPGLVAQVEAGDLNGPTTRALLARYLAPLQSRGVDTIVLGCTHFPFLSPVIAELVGPDITIIDTGLPVARQVARVATTVALTTGSSRLRCATTGNSTAVAPIMQRLLDADVPLEHADC